MKNTEVGYQAHFANAESELAEQNTHHSAMTLPIPRTEPPKRKSNTRQHAQRGVSRHGADWRHTRATTHPHAPHGWFILRRVFAFVFVRCPRHG